MGDGAIRFLLDGLEVESIRELKRLVDGGRHLDDLIEVAGEDFRIAFDIRPVVAAPFDPERAARREADVMLLIDDLMDWYRSEPTGERWVLLGATIRTLIRLDASDDEVMVVLGHCPHGVDLDRDFCDKGCRV